MNENPKLEIDELLNDLVDDQANDRQKTEFKRLLQHEPALADQLASLRQQKQLLNALPVEAAPAALAEDVLADVENKGILKNRPGTAPTLVGVGHLFLRRVLTVAAMLLLPLGLLAIIVFEIIKPPSNPGDYVSISQTLAPNDAETSETTSDAIPQTFPFDGILVFTTNQQMTVSNFVEKQIFDQGLIHYTLPNRAADSTTYQVTAPPEKIVLLIDSLRTLWPRCRQVTLSVLDNAQNPAIDIPAVQPEQIKILAQEDNGELLGRLAGRYALANQKKEDMFAANPSNPPSGFTDQGYPPLNVPIMTGRYEPNQPAVAPAQPSIKLRIHIARTKD
jgi:hypothetical protein